MEAEILRVVGGVGLFLIGMVMLTDGLRRLAGNALRRVLARFTWSPVSGAAAGALTTAVIQSSSATTVAAVGFVGAGLMTFPQALGVILGANVGTTVTGWLIAVLGFKLQLGTIAQPVALLGVLMTMFGPGRLRHLGWSLAGFSLLFIGIDVIQDGMAPFERSVTPNDFPPDTWFGRLQLLFIGVAITLVTQSSSAGVATALVALQTGTITFPLAAAMVIGMDVGTTFKTVLATIGGSTATKRTGYAHLIYNVLSAIVAFFLLDLFTLALDRWLAQGTTGDAQVALVAFHTAFNLLGLAAVLPFAAPFARLIVWMVPERGPSLTGSLDDRLLEDPGAAVDSAVAAVRAIAMEQFAVLASLLVTQPPRTAVSRLQHIREAVDHTRQFTERIASDLAHPHVRDRHLALMHALDHLSRLALRCGQSERIGVLQGERRLRRLSRVLRETVGAVAEATDAEAAELRQDRVRQLMRRQRHLVRSSTLNAAARRRLDADTALLRLDAGRWLHRVSYHVWRIVHHLRKAERTTLPNGATPPLVEEDVDD